jgi:hypothetical protein
MVYALGHKGAMLLKHDSRTTLKNSTMRKVTRFFLEHALMISDFMVSLEIACRERSDIRLIPANEIFNKHLTCLCEHQRWKVGIGGVEFGVIPDQVFGLEFMNPSGKRDSALFFLEADRATMPVIRSSLEKSSFYRKLLTYEATWRQRVHRAHFGWNRFRVLTVTTQSERVRRLIEACQQLKTGLGLFLFTDTASLESHSDFFSVIWQTPRGLTSLLA